MVSDDEIQEEILRILCELFEENPGNMHVNGQSLVDDVKDSLTNVDENEIIYNIERLGDNFTIDHSPSVGGLGTISLEVRGIDRYEQLSGSTVVPADDIEVVLELLYEKERANPQAPALSRDELLDEAGLAENTLDKVVWYLKEKHWADVLTHLGTPWYAQAEITDSGRSAYESI
jgi:hypothetical protein